MPYTLPLDSPPQPPSAQAEIVGADRKPTREFAAWMEAMREWSERIYAAAVEVEPP